VGVNKYITEEEISIPTLTLDESAEKKQIKNVEKIKAKRNNNMVKKRLEELRSAAKGSDNVMPHILNSVRAYASLGEICDVFRSVFGEYHDPKWL